ncbi:MAG: tetratricopeptide repeat protein [Bacteroidia bacterium]
MKIYRKQFKHLFSPNQKIQFLFGLSFSFIKRRVIVACFTFFFSATYAQTRNIDSLKNVLQNNSAQDTARISTIIKLCRAYLLEINNRDKIQPYIPELLQLSNKLNYKKGTAYAYYYNGLVLSRKNDQNQAMIYYSKALLLMEEINDEKGISYCYHYIAVLKSILGKYNESIEYCWRSIKIKEKLNDKQGIADSYNNLGVAYIYMGNYKSALEYTFRALKLREEINDRLGISTSCLNIGVIFLEEAKYDASLLYQDKALKIKIERGDKEGEALIYNNMADIYIAQKKYQEAQLYNLKSLKIAEEINDKRNINFSSINIGTNYMKQQKPNLALPYFLRGLTGSFELNDELNVASASNALGKCYQDLKNDTKALTYYNQALVAAKKINYKIGIRDAYNGLASLNEKLGNYEKALSYHKLFIDSKDAMLNEENLKQAAELNTRYETDKKEKEILLLTKDKQLNDKSLKEQRLVRTGLIIGLVAFLLLSSLLYNRYRFKQKANLLLEEQKEIIQQKNTLITDSIDYAKTIQEAILPDDEKLNKLFPEHFILYKPKAIVSGDFYWVGKKEDKTICVVADCTGHGVPGAFMSLLGHNILENAIQRDVTIDPGDILTALNEEIVTRFSKSKKRETVEHGMDIALISIDQKNKKLEYAGAKNSLYIIRNKELIEIKADKISTGVVGENHAEVHYLNNIVSLEQGDMLYMFSDGFPDQKGGPNKKKFFYQPFRDLLISIHELPPLEQKQKLDATIVDWIGAGEQMDDILIMGIRC